MEDILKEIIEGIKEYKINEKRPYNMQVSRGKGTKSYVIKRIDFLREKLLDMKKEII